ncbi:ABC transporter permease [Glutamicibacter halophytocola]|uniref:ABC transporter permease subunit n=1 Tax=Glutamicibacter halophytocola TaxID=1933880 RepID=UPI0006D4B0F2|nr:ABC transporter permease subunit [Glutamicibacter halophytocola]ALG30362.1 ABC transporter permease [Glutamicibacter halophytocola]
MKFLRFYRQKTSLVSAASYLLSALVLLLLAGALPWLSRTDPAAAVLRARYAELEPTPQALAAIREQLGLGQGPVHSSLQWWAGVLRGDLGSSWVSGAPIGPGAWQALSVSATLTAFASAAALLVALCLIAPAMLRVLRDRPQTGSGPLGVALTALPEFLLASILLVLVAVKLDWLPPYGWTGLDTAVLPALALGIPAGGLLGRLLADAIASVAGEPWVMIWRMAGASGPVLLAGVLRRAGAAIIDQFGLVFIGLLGGAVAVEQVFAIPGLGRFLLGSANAQDIPALQAGLLLMAGTAVLIGLLATAARRWLRGGPLPAGALSVPPEFRGKSSLLRWTAGITCTGLLAIMAFGLPRDPYAISHQRLAAPSWSLPFGADASGRDLLGRVAHGTLGTVAPAVLIVLCAVAIGLLLAGLGEISRGPSAIANATPPILAGVVIAALLGPSVIGAGVAVLWVTWPPLSAHAASLLEEARAMPHIRWLPLSGVRRGEIFVKHLLPAIVPPLLRHGMLRLPGVALALAALGFLGLGAQPPTPEWGLLLAEGIGYVERAPWTVFAPALSLVLTSVCAVAVAGMSPSRRPSKNSGLPGAGTAPASADATPDASATPAGGALHSNS